MNAWGYVVLFIVVCWAGAISAVIWTAGRMIARMLCEWMEDEGWI